MTPSGIVLKSLLDLHNAHKNGPIPKTGSVYKHYRKRMEPILSFLGCRAIVLAIWEVQVELGMWCIHSPWDVDQTSLLQAEHSSSSDGCGELGGSWVSATTSYWKMTLLVMGVTYIKPLRETISGIIVAAKSSYSVPRASK